MINNEFALSGDLNFLSLADLLQLLGSNGSTGTLTLRSEHVSEPGFIYIENGNPVNSVNGNLTGLDAIFSLFGWVDGTFGFNSEEISSDRYITKNRMELILEGLKRLDDGDIEKIGQNFNKNESTVQSDIFDEIDTTVIKGPLIDYMYIVDEERFSDGEKIIEENKYGSWMWVILDGVVEIMKDTGDGKKPLLRLGDGAFIGDVGSFLERDYSRKVSAVALGNVHLGVIDTPRLTGEYACLSSGTRKIVRSIERRLNQVAQRYLNISGTENDLSEYFKKNDPVISQGVNDKSPFVITNGEAYIVKKIAGEYVHLATLCKNDVLGTVSFLDMGHEPISADVYVSEDFTMEIMGYNNIRDEYLHLSQIFKKIIDFYALSISVTTKMVIDSLKKD